MTTISPIELIRTRIQASVGSKEAHFVHGMKNLIQEKGILFLWRGLVPTLWRDVPFSGLFLHFEYNGFMPWIASYWFLYEELKTYFDLHYTTEVKSASRTFRNDFMAGCTAGMLSAFMTHPFDVAKTIQQITREAKGKKVGMVSVMRQIVSQQGIVGLFRGITPRISKVAPACGIMISSYELGKFLFKSAL